MISILIPTYNYKVDALVTALCDEAETMDQKFEILVFDDGSTTVFSENEAINEQPYATYKYFETNQGRGAIRQKLADAATYDLLLFLDADVLPVSPNFLKKYQSQLQQSNEVICGGVSYQDNTDSSKQLRYVYGKKREAKKATIRQKEPFIIVTANLLIEKSTFFAANIELDNRYGEDLLLSQQLKLQNASVLHIDNPVWHLGLESSADYIAKSEEALRNMVFWEKEGKLKPGFTSLQRAYNRMKQWGMLSIFRWVVGLLNKLGLKSNLTSKNPSLFWFDTYRLHYYSKLKKHA